VVFDNILHSAPVAPVTLNTNAPPNSTHPQQVSKKIAIRYQVAAECVPTSNACCANWTAGKTAPVTSSSARIPAQVSMPAASAAEPARPGAQVVQCLSPPPAGQERRRRAFSSRNPPCAAAAFVWYSYCAQKNFASRKHVVENSPITVTVFLARISPDGNTCSTSEENGCSPSGSGIFRREATPKSSRRGHALQRPHLFVPMAITFTSCRRRGLRASMLPV